MIVFLWILRINSTAVREQEPWGRTQLWGPDLCGAAHHPAVQGPSQTMTGVPPSGELWSAEERPKEVHVFPLSCESDFEMRGGPG